METYITPLMSTSLYYEQGHASTKILLEQNPPVLTKLTDTY